MAEAKGSEALMLDAISSNTPTQRQPAIVQFFDLYRQSIGDLLQGTGISIDRFRGLLVETTLEQRDLIKCLATPMGRQSLISSMRKVAALGFEPGSHLGQCWILPSQSQDRQTKKWETLAHVEIGYQGYKDLMYESGLIGYIKSDIIYNTDHIAVYSLGSGEFDRIKIDRDLLVGEVLIHYRSCKRELGLHDVKVRQVELDNWRCILEVVVHCDGHL